MLIKRVFISRHHHPGKQERAAPGDDVHFPRIPHEGLHRAAVDAGVNGHKVHALFRMGADDPEEIFCGDLQQIAQIHNGFRTKLQGQVHFLHLHVIVVAVPGDAQIDVDFCAEPRPDALWGNGCMADVAGNGHFALGHQLAQGFGSCKFS